MPSDFFTLYQDPETRQFLLLKETSAEGLCGMYWRAGSGAAALPLEDMREKVSFDSDFLPVQVNQTVTAALSEHEWDEWETGETLTLHLLNPSDFDVQVNESVAIIRPRQ